MEFEEYMMHTFQSRIRGSRPLQEQDVEFVCAHPSRNGTNSLVKSSRACFRTGLRETPRVIIAVRVLLVPFNSLETILCGSPEHFNATKFWIAVRVRCTDAWGSNRSSPYRQRPEKLVAIAAEDLHRRIHEVALAGLEAAEGKLGQQRKVDRMVCPA